MNGKEEYDQQPSFLLLIQYCPEEAEIGYLPESEITF